MDRDLRQRRGVAVRRAVPEQAPLPLVTQCASAHSWASASSTAITPSMPRSSSMPTRRVVDRQVLLRVVVDDPDDGRRGRVDDHGEEAAAQVRSVRAVHEETASSRIARATTDTPASSVPLRDAHDRLGEFEFRLRGRRRRRPSRRRRRPRSAPSRAGRRLPSRSRRSPRSRPGRGSGAGTAPGSAGWRPRHRGCARCWASPPRR